MPSIRVGFGSDYTLKNQNIGIGTDNPRARLDVVGTLKGDISVSGVNTLSVYEGFVPEFQNINENLTLTGEFNSPSEDIVVGAGITFVVSVGSTVTLGSLESISVQSHFSVPNGGTSTRPADPVEGMVRFNDDLNTLEFWNGFEWRQFTVTGASGRGVFGGGANPTLTNGVSGTIDYINISSTGNAQDFGILTTARNNISSCSSNIRGVFGGGGAAVSYFNTIDYVTIASQGNAISFGTLSTTNRAYASACSSSTRGLFGGGYTTSPANAVVNVIDYIQFSTLGNAVDFGDLFTGRYSVASLSSSTRAIWGGGSAPSGNSPSNLIDFVTISSTGNAVKFGELTTKRWGVSGCSNSVRGLFAGGGISQPTFINLIDYVTIASTGNATYFGDLTESKNRSSGCATQIRGVFGGNSPFVCYNESHYLHHHPCFLYDKEDCE